MDERIEKLAALFEATGSAHHQAFIATDGADPDWPIWYADYLHDKMPGHLGVTLTRSDIVYLLVKLGHEQAQNAPGAKWPRYYARYLIEQYG